MGYKNAEVQSALSGKAVILKGEWGSKRDNLPKGNRIGSRVNSSYRYGAAADMWQRSQTYAPSLKLLHTPGLLVRSCNLQVSFSELAYFCMIS